MANQKPPKKTSDPERTEPMQTQPGGNGPNAPTPMLPVMPQVKADIKTDIEVDIEDAAPSPQKKPPRTEAEAAVAERAQIMRRKSLRRQRAAQKR